MAGLPGAGLLLIDFLRFARGRSALAPALIVAGAFLETIGIVMLVPVVALILGVAGNTDAMTMVDPVFTRLGLETTAAQIGAVLAVFATVLGLRFGVLLFRDDMLARLQHAFVADLRARAFRHLARAPWAEVSGLRHGQVGHALTRDVDRVSSVVGMAIHGGVAVVMLAVQFSIALALAPVVTLMVAVLGLGLFRSLRWLRNRAEGRGQGLTDDDLALFETVSGFLRGLKPAKAHGLENAYVSAVEGAARRLAEQNRAFARDQALARVVLQTASGGIAILAVLLGLFVLDTAPEKLIVALLILIRLHSPLTAIQGSIQGGRHAVVAYRTARAIAGPPGGAVDHGAADPAMPLGAAPEISLEAVSCRGDEGSEPGGKADASRPILDNISARIPAGMVTALVGESGAGKSTFCDMAVGLLAPDSGEVRVDGVPLDPDLARRLRASVAYVGQEPFLIEDTLRQNLCWGCGPLSDAELWAALETVGADRMVRGLDGGLDGSVRVEGTRFSGGERQRFRLARALLRKPKFLILDEATNALDLEAEADVLRAVLGARNGATVLIVSHRMATLGLVDHLIFLERGRLVEAGPIAELSQNLLSRLPGLPGRT
jgi:ATP-binding cassette subfamily C protein